ncbi:SpaA isopeptide-forming pilin-related protein [Blautia sp. HCP3S3_C12]|uniref:SpaA isopeptide-forming pilin-related protein n=1 Tax=unclassified Blautia TaxID=2648079 RepID=UPI003F88A3AA
MKESLSQQTANLKHKNNRHKRWKGIVSIFACMVVFCTVYALILPALTAEGTPHCGKEEHTHTEDCYEKKLICGKEEGEGAHHHTDECYREEQVLVCTTPESDGHQHTDDCYTEEQVLTCTNTDPDHVHNEIDGCYTTERKLTCGKEEGEGAHHHTEECYETKRELICGQEESDGHKHTDDCYKKELVCGKEEHKHILACYSDPNADVEDGNVWQRTVSSVTLTGNWGADLAAIAQTQNGYTESTANYAVAEDGQTIHGYTRYGAWANDPYRDNWSAQFADFCLSYAGVPTSAVPQNSDCSAWNYTIPDGYTPKTGDLLLLDTDSNGSADHAGIVTSVSDSTLTAIVGDADKAVRNNTYNIGSENIKGYVSIPENPALATPTPEPTKEAEVTPEAQPTQEPEATPEVTEEPTQEPENKADDAADDKADENKTQDEDVKEDDSKKDDTANNIEVTPTPTPTSEATQEVQLEQQTVTAELYTDSTYVTAEQSENAVIVSGALPENGSVKAFPVNNINMEGMKVLCAWDITIFDAEGNKWEPAEGNTIAVRFQLSELPEENADYSIYYVPDESGNEKPEEIQSEVTDDGISFNAEHFSIYAAAFDMTKNSTIKLDTYIKNVEIKHRNSDNEDWKAVTEQDPIKKNDKVGFVLNYVLPGGILSDENKTITYQIPSNIKIYHNEDGKIYDPSGAVIGTYHIDTTGKVEFEFLDKYVKSNKDGNAIKGSFLFECSASEIDTDETGRVELPFSDTVKVDVRIPDKTITTEDLKVRKTQVVDQKNGTITYTIEVISENGTADKVFLKDVMENVELDGNITITGADSNYTITNANNGFNIELPQMSANGKYTITYKAKLKNTLLNGTVKAANNVEVDSKKNNGANLHDNARVEADIEQKHLEKSGEIVGDKIRWKIIINQNQDDISGWTLSDKLNGKSYEEEVSISPAIGNSDKIRLPYTFPEGTKGTYTITYETSKDKDLGANKTINNATLSNGSGSVSAGWDVGDGKNYNPIQKEGTGITENADGKTATINWTVTINASQGPIPAGWVYTDELWDGQWFTGKQLKEMKVALDAALSKVGLQQTYTLKAKKLKGKDDTGEEISEDQITDDGKYKVYILNFSTAMEKGASFTYNYCSTAPIEEVIDNKVFRNKADINGKVNDFGEENYRPTKPVIIKTDSRTSGDETKHNYYDQNMQTDNETTMQWELKVVIPSGYNGGALKVFEQLPDGVDLKYLEILADVTSGNPIFGAMDITSVGDHKIGYYNIHTSMDGQNITIFIPEELAQNPRLKEIRFVVRVTIKGDYQWTLNKDGKPEGRFTNEVNLVQKDNDIISSDSQTQIITKDDGYKVVNKGYDTPEDNIIPYSILINEKGEDLLKGTAKEGEDKLTLTDEMTFAYYIPNGFVNVSLVPDSLKIYEYTNGVMGAELSTQDYPYTYAEERDPSSDGNVKGANVLKITIPNKKAVLVKYKYKVSGKIGLQTTFSNTAKLEGVNRNDTSSGSNVSLTIQSSTATAQIDGITIYKTDENNASIGLKDAEFKLFRWDANQNDYVPVSNDTSEIFQTDSDGRVSLTNLAYNTAYKLIEEKAPEGYIKSTEPFYFMVDNSDTTNHPLCQPGGFAGKKCSAGEVVYYTNKKNNTDIQINKKWLNEAGDDVTASQTGEVGLELWRKVSTNPYGAGKIEDVGLRFDINNGTAKPEGSIPTAVMKGSKVVLTIKEYYNKTALRVWIRGVEVTPVSQRDYVEEYVSVREWMYSFDALTDTNVKAEIYDNNIKYSVAYTEPSTGGDDVKDEQVPGKIYTLSQKNNWTTTIKDLPKTGTENGKTVYYSYYVKEIGRTPISQENNEGITEGVITLTNRADDSPSYVLPETGGIGTNRFTAVGLALMAGSLMCGYVMRRKRRERRGN